MEQLILHPALSAVLSWDRGRAPASCLAVSTGGMGPEDDPEKVKAAIIEGFLQTDKHLHSVARREGWERGGSTVVAALISPYYIYFANCGDSRAMLCRSGQVCFSTEDHKPYSPLEKERIESAGGSVTIQRINGSLAVSRALGDFSYKGAENRTPSQQMVSPEPEVCVVARSPADEFLVLACDGVWDTISNEELCAFIHNRLQVCTDLRDVCTQVIDLCLYKVRVCLLHVTIILLMYSVIQHCVFLHAHQFKREILLNDLKQNSRSKQMLHNFNGSFFM